MATNRLKVMLSFLREVNDGNLPKASDYGLSPQEYWEIVDAAQDDGLIKGATFSRGGQNSKILCGFLDGVQLTVKGMEYLDNHAPAMKLYKGLKELRDWLPF